MLHDASYFTIHKSYVLHDASDSIIHESFFLHDASNTATQKKAAAAITGIVAAGIGEMIAPRLADHESLAIFDIDASGQWGYFHKVGHMFNMLERNASGETTGIPN